MKETFVTVEPLVIITTLASVHAAAGPRCRLDEASRVQL